MSKRKKWWNVNNEDLNLKECLEQIYASGTNEVTGVESNQLETNKTLIEHVSQLK